MSSRKKGKKTKGTTLALNEFLGPDSVPSVALKTSSWADDVDDDPEPGFTSRNSKEPVVLPTAPRAARDSGADSENIPTSPPYVAYISNLPYDITEDDLTEFFDKMEISNMRLPKDSNKLKGYGYVEFTNRQSLIDSLNLSGTAIKTRRVKIEVSNSSNDDRRGGRMGMGRDNRRDNYDDNEKTSGDWRSRPKEDLLAGNDDRFRSRGNFDSRDRRGGAGQGGGEDRESDNKPGGWREGDRSSLAFNDRRNYRDDDRRGFRDDDKRGFRDDKRRNYQGSGGGGDEERSRESTWRSEPAAPQVNEEPEPRTRTKLVLQPRTKPIEPIIVTEEPKLEEKEQDEEEIEEEEEEEVAVVETVAPTPVPAVNIFGAAKPVDTAAREREIEERLAKAAEKPKLAAADEGENKSTWQKRNGEGRVDREKEKSRGTWRSDEDRGRTADRRHDMRGPSSRSDYRGETKGDSRGSVNSRSAQGSYRNEGRNDSRRLPEKERRSKDRDDGIPPMPKATDEKAPNFAVSNKYSMLLREGEDTDTMDN